MKVTKQQEERLRILMRFLREYQSKHGYMPSRKEMRLHLGIKSDKYVTDLVAIAVSLGHIENHGKHRGLRIVKSIEDRIRDVENEIKSIREEMIPRLEVVTR